MMLFRFLFSFFLITFAGNFVSAQTCQSLFEKLSVFSKFSSEDQRTLTLLAQRQVEVTADFSISKAQKDTALNHLKEQLEEFIGSSGLNTMEKQTLRREYRALVFQFKEQAGFTIDTQLAVINHKNKLIEITRIELIREKELIRRKELEASLLEKYSHTDLRSLLRFLLNFKGSPEYLEDFRKVATLLDNFDIRSIDTALILQTSIGLDQPKHAEILINSGADVNTLNKQGVSALMKATSHNQLDIMKLLIEKGADVNVKDKKGTSPLLRSVEAPSAEILINNGANVNDRNSDGDTLLHLHITDLYMAQILIPKGLDVNAKNNAGQSLLAKALTMPKFGNIDGVIHLLKKNGATE